MKALYEHAIGGDGAVGGLYLDGGKLKAEVSYPVAALAKPVTDAVDSIFDKAEALIPGDFDKTLLEPLRKGIKDEIVKVLSE